MTSLPQDTDPPARSLYAFVEYEDWRAAEDAYHRLHGKPFGTGVIKLQWARSGRRPDFDRDRRDYAAAEPFTASSRFVDPRDVERRTHGDHPARRSSRSPEQQRRTAVVPRLPLVVPIVVVRGMTTDVEMGKQR